MVLKAYINELLNPSQDSKSMSKVVDIFIMLLIILNLLTVILGTVKSIESSMGNYFRKFEVFSIVVFTIEYFLRLWTAAENDNKYSGMPGRVKYFFSLSAIIDLLAILPFYLPVLIKVDLRMLRILRLFRMFRVLKMGRYIESLTIFSIVLKNKKEQLVMTAATMLVILIIASSVLYIVENQAQPQAFGSIPAAMWWGVAALTSVGYGDVYPVTTIGKIIGSIIASLGIGMYALPAGILASGFNEAIEEYSCRDKSRVKRLINKISNLTDDEKKEILSALEKR